MILTIDIDITNNKALALLNYIRTLDFINIKEQDYSLTDQQKTILKERKQKHLNGKSKSYAWEDIKEEINNRHEKV